MRKPSEASLDSSFEGSAPLEAILEARLRPVDSLTVRRLFPTPKRRSVGPFVFFDHMGPSDFEPGDGVNVRPHPHIGLATVTYLFEGEVLHRDSLGNKQVIRPGEVNWMTAGRGIVHSERPVPGGKGNRLHGLQLWVALPLAEEECAPRFEHYGAEALPLVVQGGARVRVVVGNFGEKASAVQTLSSMYYLDVELDAGASVLLPMAEERGIYGIEGSFQVGSERVDAGKLAIVASGYGGPIHSENGARVVVLGGDRLDAPRFIEWNFVASSEARIRAAKDRWRGGGFPAVPGDEVEFIPLPPDPT